MKLQYLGDSKDAFKWDYHDRLASTLGMPTLTVVPMLTPDDGGTHGKTPPEDFPSGEAVLRFCHGLRQARGLDGVCGLPSHTGSAYSVVLHKPDVVFDGCDRKDYFGGLAAGARSLVFADPDNGFEPEGGFDERHIRYEDVAGLLDRAPEGSVVSVFQHFRRVKFLADFAGIRRRLGCLRSTAVCWGGRLMFVAVAKSGEAIEAMAEANRKYAVLRPVVTAIP